MPILLSDEEIDEAILGEHAQFDAYRRTARSQLKKFVGWGDKRCREHPYVGQYGKYYLLQHECCLCWQSIKEEAGL